MLHPTVAYLVLDDALMNTLITLFLLALFYFNISLLNKYLLYLLTNFFYVPFSSLFLSDIKMSPLPWCET